MYRTHAKRRQGLPDSEAWEGFDYMSVAMQPYFVPETTTLDDQMRQFIRRHTHFALVVDEYGDIQGLVTLDDILEEIVGEFTTDPSDVYREVQPEADGTFVVQGSANVRELNRTMHWRLPVEGPKTLNGLILEHLEATGQADNTYIFFTADHGLSVGQHGLMGKQSMYDHSMRPPLLVAGPGIPQGRR